VVPGDFTGYFAAAAAAAGVLIGLLFVAVSLRPESVLGDSAEPAALAMSGSAFTALVNSFFVSLIALIPGAGLGYPAAVMALVSLYSTFRLHRGLARQQAAVLQLVLSLASYLGQLGVGVALIIRPHAGGLVYDVAWLLIASFAMALRRAWSLMQGKPISSPRGGTERLYAGMCHD
jgi:hypothetical protein